MRLRTLGSLTAITAVLIAAQASSAQTIRGHLLDAVTGTPIGLGLVLMSTESGDSVTHTVIDSRGHFSITSPDPGTFELIGSSLGYEESREGVFDLGMGGELTVEFRLSPAPLPIDELLLELEGPVFEHELVRNGFVRRLQRNAGGRFITPHEIERSTARTTEALFHATPGVRVRAVSNVESHLGDVVLMHAPKGGTCLPSVFVDGIPVRYDPASGSTLSMFVPLGTVQAVEAYRSPSEVPVEYNRTRSTRPPQEELCGVLVFWTR